MFRGLDIALNDTPSPALSDQHLHGLARTFDRAVDPVWIEDARGFRLYANPSAGTDGVAEPASLSFEILDHDDRVLGRLRTACR